MKYINDLTKYKQAKIVKKDIDDILIILNNSIFSLNKFSGRYSLVRESIITLEELKATLIIHKKNIKKIIENKAIIVDNNKDE